MVTIQFVPYTEIEDLTSAGRIRKLLSHVKDGKIVVLQGKLKKEEEMELIKVTMEEINKEFKGIEIAVIDPKEVKQKSSGLRHALANFFAGDRLALTVIGPAQIVKEIKKDPSRIELITKSNGRRN